MHNTAKAIITTQSKKQKALVTTRILEQNRSGAEACVTKDLIEICAGQPPLELRTRSDRILTYLKQESSFLGQFTAYDYVTTDGIAARFDLMAWTESTEDEELEYLIDFTRQRGFVETHNNRIRLTPAGYDHLETNVDSQQGFVAMWFGGKTQRPWMDQAYTDGFSRAIADSGFRALRIDQKEHIGRIDDEIIAEIRRSRFLVADFTCERGKSSGGVYFEAGFAQGLGIPVIWTCHKDSMSDLHFDIRQYAHIEWEKAADLRDKLRNRIGAVLGWGRAPKLKQGAA